MAKHKLRASGQPLAKFLASCNISLDKIPPGDDGWHDHDSLLAALVSGLSGEPLDVCADAVQAAALTPESTRGWVAAATAKAERGQELGRDLAGETAAMTPDQAFRTGRITAASVPAWEARHRVDPSATGATLASLAPVLASGLDTVAPGSPPVSRLDAIDDELFGPHHNEASVQRARNVQDAAALAEFEATEARERTAAANALTAAEYESLFGKES
jgi:hypothetical protein